MSPPAGPPDPNDLQRLIEELARANAEADAALDAARKQQGTLRWDEYLPDPDDAPLRSEEDDDY